MYLCGVCKLLSTSVLLTLVGVIGLMLIRTKMYLDENTVPKTAPMAGSDFTKPLPWTTEEQSEAVHRFSRAIQFPTVLYERDRTVFDKMFTQIMKDFPILFSEQEGILREITSDIQKDQIVDGEKDYLASRVWVWRGKNGNTKKPIMLTAHVDVVPINDESKWTYPPFSGKLADGYINGRGTLDDKNGVFEILEAINQLKKDHILEQPDRDIYVVIGMDEEIGGAHGAQKVTSYFFNRNISFAFILDEGGQIADKQFPTVDDPTAFVATSEKGFCNYAIDVQCEPGHAALPQATNCIGMMAKAITSILENPMPAHFDKPLIQNTLKQLVPRSNNIITKIIAANLDILSYPLGKAVAKMGGPPNAMVRTTFAPTIVKAGVQNNVMPSFATHTLNVRFAPYDTIESVKNHLIKVINSPNVTVTPLKGDGHQCEEASSVSCTDCIEFEVLKRSINKLQPDAVVTPYLFLAGSDSRHYRKLSTFAYGYLPMRLEKANEDLQRIHGHNERIKIDNYIESVNVYSTIIQNADRLLSERP